MKIDVTEWEIGSSEWVSFISSLETGTVFHHPSWFTTLEAAYNVHPYLVKGYRDGTLVAGVPIALLDTPILGKRVIALPFTDACHVLGDQRDEPEIIQACYEWARYFDPYYLEVRSPHRGCAITSPHQVGWMHTTTLSDSVDTIWNHCHKTRVRQCIDRARRHGVQVDLDATWNMMEEYINLHIMTRMRLRAPMQPWRYFSALWRHVIHNGLGVILIARYRGLPVAGGIIIMWNGTAIYKHGATNRQYGAICANHLLVWQAMLWAKRSGAHTFWWGRTGRQSTSLREFKSGWHGAEYELEYQRYGSANSARVLARTLAIQCATCLRRIRSVRAYSLTSMLYKEIG